MATDKKTTPVKKAATTTTKSATKTATKKASTVKKPVAKKAPAKRERKSVKLYAEVSLGKLKELFDDNEDAVITVSRNFVLDAQKKKIEDAAQLELGL